MSDSFATPWTAAHHGISQARILEWAAISFSRGSSQPRDRTHGPCRIPCTAGRFFPPESLNENINIFAVCNSFFSPHIWFKRQGHKEMIISLCSWAHNKDVICDRNIRGRMAENGVIYKQSFISIKIKVVLIRNGLL